MSKNNSSSSGIGLSGFIFLIFMTLKLTGYINWSWWWVTSPLWLSVVLGLIVVIVFKIIK